MRTARTDCVQSLATAATSSRISSRPERFYAALYPGEDGCVFNEERFSGCEDVYAKLLKADAADPIADVISVYDLGEGNAILYSEVESQECFLAKV